MAYAFKDYPEIEYLDGLSYPKVSPKRTHGLVQFALALILRRCGGAFGNVATEWRFKLSGDTEFVPDVAFVSFERLRLLTDEQAEEPPFAPDIAVEVRSPSGRATYEASKIDRYLQCGSTLVLDVDPKVRAIYAHAIGAEPAAYRARERFGHKAVPWLTFEVDEVFADLKIPR